MSLKYLMVGKGKFRFSYLVSACLWEFTCIFAPGKKIENISEIIKGMDLKGNIFQIKNKRDEKNKDIQIEVSQIDYITDKKDGRYYQAFEYTHQLDTPLIITGDCLARIDNKYLEEGEYDFEVYDHSPEGYLLNLNKRLSVTTEFIPEDDLTILTSVLYSVTVSNEEFNAVKNQKGINNRQRKHKK